VRGTRIVSLNHASIRVGDLARSRAFYEGLLGLDTAPRPDLGFPGAWYAIGDSQLHLIQQQKVFEDIDPTDPHVALEVEDLAAVRRELDARGIAYRDFGGKQLWIVDPDGNVVELCERT
jgi:catechol 2,3-dioxygenase-like lactoylglutathione lyase family enzyme